VTGGPGVSPDNSGQLALVLEQLRQTVWSLADEAETVGPGWLARTPSLPDVWALNQLHITHPVPPAEVIALAEERQADLSFRHIRVEPEGTALELASTLGGAGWKVDREVLMALAAPPARAANTDAVVELSEPQMEALMRRWLSEDFPDVETSRLDQVGEYARREGELWGERCFGALGHSGAPAAITKLRSREGVAWVEDVYTVPEERNKGFARALVTHAAGLARQEGHALTFIIADDNDWPKHLYEETGFRPLGLTWTFHRAGTC
jgi:GNAT superfamily N-acetyltransferase